MGIGIGSREGLRREARKVVRRGMSCVPVDVSGRVGWGRGGRTGFAAVLHQGVVWVGGG